MANDNKKIVNFFKVLDSELNGIAFKEGQVLFTTDTHKLYLDTGNDRRVQIEGFDYGLSINGENITIVKNGTNETIALPTYSAGEGLNLNENNEFSNTGVRSVSAGSTAASISVNTGGTSREVIIPDVATLDQNGKIPSSQLPSYVDDIIEGYYKVADGKFYKESTYTTEISPETGKIYVDLSKDQTYRWSGSQYTIIKSDIALGETDSTAYYGDRGKIAYDHAADANKITTATQSGLYKIASTTEGHIASLTAVNRNDIVDLGIDNEIVISDVEPTGDNWKIWINSEEIGSQGSEIINSYSNSTSLGYSANYINKLTDAIATNNAYQHNNIYRGKNITTEWENGTISENIANGTFKDIYIGDYFINTVTINNIEYELKYIIADLDTYYGYSEHAMISDHHIGVIVTGLPDAPMVTNINLMQGGYISSTLCGNTLITYLNSIKASLGELHILQHNKCLTRRVNITSNFNRCAGTFIGASNDREWYPEYISLLTECQVYGHIVWSSSGYDTGEAYKQLALFKMKRPNEISGNKLWWLRDIGNGMQYAAVGAYGDACCYDAIESGGVIPLILLK